MSDFEPIKYFESIKYNADALKGENLKGQEGNFNFRGDAIQLFEAIDGFMKEHETGAIWANGDEDGILTEEELKKYHEAAYGKSSNYSFVSFVNDIRNFLLDNNAFVTEKTDGKKSMDTPESFAEVSKLSAEDNYTIGKMLFFNQQKDPLNLFDEHGLMTNDLNKIKELIAEGAEGLEMTTNSQGTIVVKYDNGDGNIRTAIFGQNGLKTSESLDVKDSSDGFTLVFNHNGKVIIGEISPNDKHLEDIRPKYESYLEEIEDIHREYKSHLEEIENK